MSKNSRQADYHWDGFPRNLNGSQRKQFARATLFLKQGGLCFHCQKPVILGGGGERKATLDHLIPLSKGGSSCETNVVLACYQCNHLKADK